MIVKKIACENFRNFEKLEFCPGPGINVIYGENAQGKTNLLEAIWLFCGAKSFRGAKDREMVGFEKSKARNSCDFIFGQVEKTAEILIEEKRCARFGNKPLSSAAELAGRFYSIVFSPLDLNLVNGAPGMRRKFLDTAIGQIFPVYNKALRSYIKAVDQRNRVLRDLKYHPDLEPLLGDFETALSHLMHEVLKYRFRYMQLLQNVVPEIYHGISSGREELSIHYVSAFTLDSGEEEIKQALFRSRKNDCFAGSTSIGPHRDDILFCLNQNNARKFGSQGQRRSIALALKLSEVQVIKQITGEFPIALLDDVMSELDESRQDFILNHIRQWQVFLTCCDPKHISGLKNGAVFEMKNGTLL